MQFKSLLFALVTYTHVEGCKGALPCNDGRICGKDTYDGSCGSCTLGECIKRAENTNSFAFAFGRNGYSNTYCYMCNEADYINRKSQSYSQTSPVGIYIDPEKRKGYKP